MREAAWPLIRDDLALSYGEVGLLLAVPAVVAAIVEPVLGVLAVTRQRRVLVLGGGAAFAAALAMAGGAGSFPVLLASFALLYPASGAFVSLSQAWLVDVHADRRERAMARWTLAGSVGAVAGPVALTACLAVGIDWRVVMGALAAASGTLVALAARLPREADPAVDRGLRRPVDVLRTLVRRNVLRWLLLLELSDLLLDVLLAFIALYVVDELGGSPAGAALAVGVYTLAGLLGSILMLPLLERIDGLRYLRVSAGLSGVIFCAFLLVPSATLALPLLGALAITNAGWYPVLQARLYEALGDASGLTLTVGALVPLNTMLPLAIALLAGWLGLAAALWPLLLAPVALLLLVPRRVPCGR